MSDMPVPEKRNVILINAVGEPTRHVYSHTEEVPFVGPDHMPDGVAYAYFFRCLKTGALRIFGNQYV